MAVRRRKVTEKDYDMLIKASEAKIEKLSKELKEERANLKTLNKDKIAFEAMKAEREQLERTKKVAEMIAASGKSLEEIEAFLSGK